MTLIPEPEGGYSVLVPELPSVATRGETVDDALAMAKEAIAESRRLEDVQQGSAFERSMSVN